MKRTFFPLNFLLLLAFLVFPGFLKAQSSAYKSPDQVHSWIRQMEQKHPGVLTSINITSTPGERPLGLIRIGKEPESKMGTNPSIFVGANLEGNRPLATEGAIFLAESILSDPASFDSLNWYILPLGNPDAAAKFFEAPLFEDSRNDLSTNDDRDEQTDEDGVNDLNGDGWITKMRVIHPEGEWIISDKDPRLMQKADPKRANREYIKYIQKEATMMEMGNIMKTDPEVPMLEKTSPSCSSTIQQMAACSQDQHLNPMPL